MHGALRVFNALFISFRITVCLCVMQYAIVLAVVILVELILIILFFTKKVSRSDCL